MTAVQASDLGRPLEGVLWMVGAGLTFVGVNGIVRYLGTELPAAQSAFIRFGFGRSGCSAIKGNVDAR